MGCPGVPQQQTAGGQPSGGGRQLQHGVAEPYLGALRQREQVRGVGLRVFGSRQLHRNVLRFSRGSGEHVRREDHQVLLQLRRECGEAGARTGAIPGGDHERVPVSHCCTLHC